MNEYSSRKRNSANRTQNKKPDSLSSRFMTDGMPNSAVQSVLQGKSAPSAEMLGHRENLSQSMEAKMSRAFGMDLSQMKLYRSDAMSGSDLKGISGGNRVVLSTDIDLNTLEGQQILGHEISHLHAQSQGIGLGHSGLYENADLEHKADTEGAMAARGLNHDGSSAGILSPGSMGNISSLAPLGSGMAASAGAPMQAFSLKNHQQTIPKQILNNPTEEEEVSISKQDLDVQKKLSSAFAPGKNGTTFKNAEPPKNSTYFLSNFMSKCFANSIDKTLKDKILKDSPKAYSTKCGLSDQGRITDELCSKHFKYLNNKQKEKLAHDLFKGDTNEQKDAKLKLKEIRLKQLQGYEKKYGRLFEQMEPETMRDFIGGDTYSNLSAGLSFQDVYRNDSKSNDPADQDQKYLPFGDERDEQYERLENYYFGIPNHISTIGNCILQTEITDPEDADLHINNMRNDLKSRAENDNGESLINGPMLNPDELAAYQNIIEKKRKSENQAE